MIKKIIQFSCAVGLAFSLVSCGTAQPEATGAPFIESAPTNPSEVTSSAPTKKVALVLKTLTNPFFVEMENGARRAESEFGIELIVKTGAQETSIQQQIAIVENLIELKVDAIVIAPGDSKELIPALKKAQDAGIKVVNIDNQLDTELSQKLGLTDVPFISVDNENGAYLSAKFISDQITIPTKVVLLEGIQEARNAQDRLAGAKRAFGENPNITIVASETAHWKIDEAHDLTMKLFQTNPDIGAIFCANDMMALGAIQYLEEANLSNVLVAGYDNLKEAQLAIKDGKMASTIDQQAAMQGYMGVQYALDLINGVSVSQLNFVDVILVTQETLK